LLACVGVFFLFISLISLLVSLAMPGVGWLIAASSLMAISLLTPFIGANYVIASLIVSAIHLFSLGPFSGMRTSVGLPAGMTTEFVIVTVVIPAAAAFISIFLSWRPLKSRKESGEDS
jgi:hypothetical protein